MQSWVSNRNCWLIFCDIYGHQLVNNVTLIVNSGYLVHIMNIKRCRMVTLGVKDLRVEIFGDGDVIINIDGVRELAMG